MTELLAPVDAEAVLFGDLSAGYQAHSETSEVGTKIPKVRPTKFTKVRLMGGSADYFSSSPMLTVECWAPTEGAAWDLVSLAVALVDSLPERVGICSGITNVGEPVNQPDPDSNTPRYVFTKVLHLRKHAL